MNLLSEESAISVSSKMSVPTDQNNIPLRYTGEENFAEFRANFQRYCKDHDLADLFDETLLKASPKYPEDLLIKLNSNQDLTESEDRRLSLWRNSKSKQNLLASRAIHLLKLTLSQPILDQLRSQYSSDEQAPSLAELNRLFQILQEAYGGYNFYRARRSLQALENLPVFTDSKSIKANIFKIHNLQLERVSWSNLTPAPGTLVTDYTFTEAQLKENLIRMMSGNNDLQLLHVAFRTRPGNFTYKDMCTQLTSFANDYMLPTEEQARYQKLNNVSVALTPLTKLDDSTSSSPIASNLSAMATNVQSSLNLPSSLQKQCFKCGESGHNPVNCSVTSSKPCLNCGEHGHFSSECPHVANASGKQCYKCGEYGHSASYCKNVCFKCNRPGHIYQECPQRTQCRNCGGVGHVASQCSSSLNENTFSNTVLGKRQQPHRRQLNNRGAQSKFKSTNSGTRSRTQPPSLQAHLVQIDDEDQDYDEVDEDYISGLDNST